MSQNTIVLPGELSFEKKHTSPFIGVYNDEEVDEIIEIATKGTQTDLYDGECVRLDGIYETDRGLQLSPMNFYDFFCTNILLDRYRDWVRLCDTPAQRDLLVRLPKLIKKEMGGLPDNLYDVLDCPYLANILAVSTIIKDSTERFLFTRRNTNVAVSAGYTGVSLTGSVDRSDMNSFNPVVACTIREAKEELGIDLYPEEVYLHRITLAPNKLQPVALSNVALQFKFEQFDIYDRTIGDTDEENERYLLVHQKDVLDLLDSEIFTEVADEHVRFSLPNEYFDDDYDDSEYDDDYEEENNHRKLHIPSLFRRR